MKFEFADADRVTELDDSVLYEFSNGKSIEVKFQSDTYVTTVAGEDEDLFLGNYDICTERYVGDILVSKRYSNLDHPETEHDYHIQYFGGGRKKLEVISSMNAWHDTITREFFMDGDYFLLMKKKRISQYETVITLSKSDSDLDCFLTIRIKNGKKIYERREKNESC